MSQSPWHPSRGVVILLGLLSLWPFAYMGLFFAVMAFSFAGFQSGDGGQIPDLFKYICTAAPCC
jgi:hypothetical protein